jgi:prevent-host-death family protein
VGRSGRKANLCVGAILARIVTVDDLRANLGRELDAIRQSEDALYVTKRGRLAGVLIDAERYAELIERLDYLEDSLAALKARDERDAATSWTHGRTVVSADPSGFENVPGLTLRRF